MSSPISAIPDAGLILWSIGFAINIAIFFLPAIRGICRLGARNDAGKI